MPAAGEPPVVSFLSDYGTADELVAVCKGVMLRIAPSLRVLDVTHEVPAHDVRAGALALARAAQYLPPGVLLAVVDPGVGTDRRAVAVEVDEGFLVGPDNGLLAPAVAMLGGARRAVSLTNRAFQLPSPSPTFAGRDVFAPAAAHLGRGVDPGELGEAIEPASLVPSLIPLTHDEGPVVHGEVLWLDRFGNAQLNVDPDELRLRGLGPGDRLEVRWGDDRRTARWVATYAEARPSELAVVVDSYGLVSLALDRDSAADALRLHVGAGVALGPAGH